MKKIIAVVLIFTVFFVACDTSLSNKYYENIYQEYSITERNINNLTWPEGQVLPSFPYASEVIDVIDVTNINSDTKTMLVSLQGIVNRKQPRIFLYEEETEGKEKWLEHLNIAYHFVTEKEVIEKYKDEITGIIIWDKKVRDTLNLADTLSGLENAIVCSNSLAKKYTTDPYNFSVVEDYTGRFEDKYEVYDYLYEELWNRCNKKLIVGLNPEKDGHITNLRDLAIASKSAVIWFDTTVGQGRDLIRKFFSDCEPGKTYYVGWWSNEGIGVKIGSEYGIPLIPADFYENYSIYASMTRELEIPEIPSKPKLENKFYIAFAFADGDNLQYIQHAMKSNTTLWTSKKRGLYPISWTFSPIMMDAGPQIMNWYYKTATANDCFITGPSGLGYTDPIWWNSKEVVKREFPLYIKNADFYFRQTGFKVATIWNFLSDEQASLISQYAPSLYGFTVQERLPGQKYDYIVDNNMPLLTTHPRYDGDISRVQEIIEDQICKWNKKEPQFMMPQIIPWECGVAGINQLAEKLQEKYGKEIEFVRADHLMMLYREANHIPYNFILQTDNIITSDASNGNNIVDGSFSSANGWTCDSEEKWFVIDLEGEYQINRYCIMNAATAYYDKKLNTKSYKIQASNDGVNWKTIDEVIGNTSNIVDKYVDSFSAKYIRFYITDAGLDGIARIQEFELYGVKQ